MRILLRGKGDALSRERWFNACRARTCAPILLLLAGLRLFWPETVQAGYASFVMEADTGQVLHADSADDLNHPASLAKMMTLYVLFQALAEGQLTLGTPMNVSAGAVTQLPSKLNLPLGATISANNAILALVIKSANDVAYVVAETLGGRESDFAVMMTATARQLGMRNTTFRNSSGLPDKAQITTARDMAILGLALIRDYPQYYHYFSRHRFQYNKQDIKTHNQLLLNYKGADGIKTGYIAASGFNLVTSARRGDKRLIGVVLGGKTSRWRDAHMADLFDAAFARLSGKPMTTIKRVSPPKRVNNESQKKSIRVTTQGIQKAHQTEARKSAQHPQVPLDTMVRRNIRHVETRKIVSHAVRTAQPITAPQTVQATQSRLWGIQIGSFRQIHTARAAVISAVAILKMPQHKPSIAIIPAKIEGNTLYHARLMGMTSTEAGAACTRVLGRVPAQTCRVVPLSGKQETTGWHERAALHSQAKGET